MPRLILHKHPVITYSMEPQQRYWKAMSKFIADKHGIKSFDEQAKVNEILLDCFNFFVGEFRKLVLAQNEAGFFLYIFWLNEESFKLVKKLQSGAPYNELSEVEFQFYRRVLKLILEQGCEIDFPAGKYPDAKTMLQMDIVIEDLIYLGTWVYHMADDLAYHDMAENGHKVEFDNKQILSYPWQYHYGKAYDLLMQEHKKDYKYGVYDKLALKDLRAAIEICFGISYEFAEKQIYHIKNHFGKGDPCQTVSPEVLPKNLSNASGIHIDLATAFYEGLTISRKNMLSIEEVVYKPHSMQRYLFRPILIYNIAGEDRALIGEEKFEESIFVLGTNSVQWNKISDEWYNLPCMKKFIDKKALEHDKLLEDAVEEICSKNKLLFLRNVTSLKQNGDDNINIIDVCGEIDFIIANVGRKILYIADSKYHRARYDGVGYKTDNTNFISKYEPKLSKKLSYISSKIPLTEYNLKHKFPEIEFDLSKFKIEGLFFINTPTFYMFNGKYKAITLHRLEKYFTGKFDYPVLHIETAETNGIYRHPYFRKPIIFNF